MILAIPAAVSRCPILVLTVPKAQNDLLSVYLLKALSIALISIGSPIIVPVPWASIYEIVDASIDASFSAISTTSC